MQAGSAGSGILESIESRKPATTASVPDAVATSRLYEAALLCCLLVLGAFAILFHGHRSAVAFDSAAYIVQSIGIAEGRGNTMHFGGEDFPGVYPSGYPAIVALLHLVLGVRIENGALASLGCSLLTLLVVYFVARRLAGPLAGATAMTMMLASRAFAVISTDILSQSPSLLVFVVVGAGVLFGPASGGWSFALRLATGTLAGASPLLRFTNAPLLVALFVACLVVPPPGQSRVRGALPFLLGLMLGGSSVLLENHFAHGSPFAHGYDSWGFEAVASFSFDYLFAPLVVFGGGRDMGIAHVVGARSAIQIAWLLLAGIGVAMAFVARRRDPAAWRFALLALASFVTTGLLLAFYFFRSPLYPIVNFPFVAILAAVAMHRMLEGLAPRRVAPRLVPLVLALAAAVPTLYEDRSSFPQTPQLIDADLLRRTAAFVEDDALLIGGVNPFLVEFLVNRGTAREFQLLTASGSRWLQRIATLGLGSEPGGDGLEAAVLRRLEAEIAAGRPCYVTLLPAAVPRDGGMVTRFVERLPPTLTSRRTPVPGLLRVQFAGDGKAAASRVAVPPESR